MADRWVVTCYNYKFYSTMEDAEAERDRLAADNPHKSFRLLRAKTSLKGDGGWQRLMDKYEAALAEIEELKKNASCGLKVDDIGEVADIRLRSLKAQ